MKLLLYTYIIQVLAVVLVVGYEFLCSTSNDPELKNRPQPTRKQILYLLIPYYLWFFIFIYQVCRYVKSLK
jgi:hypothetical protein